MSDYSETPMSEFAREKLLFETNPSVKWRVKYIKNRLKCNPELRQSYTDDSSLDFPKIYAQEISGKPNTEVALLESCIKLNLEPEEVHGIIKEYIREKYSGKNNKFAESYYKSWCAIFPGIEPDEEFLQQI